MSLKKVSTTKNRLCEAMRIRNKKQVDLVNETGINKGTISRYLSGKYEPKTDTLAKLATALDCSEMWLLGYDEPMDRYAHMNPCDAEFLRNLPPLHPKEELPPEVEAINVLLYPHGKNIIKIKGRYFMDECGELSEDELNELLNAVIIATKNAVELLTAKRTNELRQFFASKKS